MAETSKSRIRGFRREDVGFACSLVELAGWNQLPCDWFRLLDSEPEGCFLIEYDSVPAGTATTTSYGNELGWIGMVLVHPDFRRKGLATQLLRRCLKYLLEERGVDCVKLDATPDGKKVYEKLGFREEYHLSRWSGSGLPGPASPPCSPPHLWPEPKDAEAFGTDRTSYLKQLHGDSDRSEVGVDGLALSRPGRIARYLGPVTAGSPIHGASLVKQMLRGSADETVFWDIPEDNREAVELAESLHFERKRSLIRMWTGNRNVTGPADLQWAIGAPETG